MKKRRFLKIYFIIVIVFIYSNFVLGESAKTQKATSQSEKFSIELHLPSYYPEYFRHPRKFFSGREIEIKGGTGISPISLGRAAAPRLLLRRMKHDADAP